MKRWLSKAETTLGNHSDRLNAINIFPVADGDTGTNLYLTVRAAARALQGLDTAAIPRSPPRRRSIRSVRRTPPRTTSAPSSPRAGLAAMEEARGNSGTLFAVFLCAAAEPLAGHSRLSAPLLAAALNRAQLRAWSALSDPVPGTMLSVMEAAARAAAAVESAHDGDDSNHTLGLALDAAVDAAVAAVVRTEDQLEALHDAHVVDAGGVGMLLILDCLRSAVLGEELQDQLLDGLHGYDVQDPHIHAGMPRDEGVEVMCTITLSPLDAAMMRQRLDEMGDSVIMSQVGGTADASGAYRWRVHVHVPALRARRRPDPVPRRTLGHQRQRARRAGRRTRATPVTVNPQDRSPTDMNADLASAGLANAELGVALERRIGKRSAGPIEKHLGITTVGGLLNYFPRRYMNRGELTPISEVPLDEDVTLIARVVSSSTRFMTHPPRLADRHRDYGRRRAPGPGGRRHPEGELLQRLRAKAELQPGRRALFSGKITRYGGALGLTNPDFQLLDEDPDTADGPGEARRHAHPGVPGYRQADQLVHPAGHRHAAGDRGPGRPAGPAAGGGHRPGEIPGRRGRLPAHPRPADHGGLAARPGPFPLPGSPGAPVRPRPAPRPARRRGGHRPPARRGGAADRL